MSIQFQDPQEVTQIQRLLALGKTDDALKLALNYLTQVEKAGMAVQIRYFARNALCVVYTSTRDDSKAEQECTRAIELMPSHWSAWNNRGTLRYLMGDMAGAHADYQQALGHSGNKNDVVDLLTHNLSLVRFKSMLQQ
jgi:tetratricopeptide (TPR) repeat protein